MSIPSYSSIYNLGHKAIEELAKAQFAGLAQMAAAIGPDGVPVTQ